MLGRRCGQRHGDRVQREAGGRQSERSRCSGAGTTAACNGDSRHCCITAATRIDDRTEDASINRCGGGGSTVSGKEHRDVGAIAGAAEAEGDTCHTSGDERLRSRGSAGTTWSGDCDDWCGVVARPTVGDQVGTNAGSQSGRRRCTGSSAAGIKNLYRRRHAVVGAAIRKVDFGYAARGVYAYSR